MTYRDALAWLYATQRHGIKLGLETTQRLLRELRLELAQRVIHVAGTNGKGSVCAMADAVCRAAGHRTGLFTSPHLVSFRERVRVSGKVIEEQDVASGLTHIRDLVDDWEIHPTFFEITTALALQYFEKSGCDIVVLETGMGGRLDATNAVRPLVSVITPIDFDHEKWLGHSLAKIAEEKAGIIKRRVPVVSAPQLPEAEAVIRKKAMECDAPLQVVTAPWTKTPVGLRGEYQKLNASVAIEALRAGAIPTTDQSIAQGLLTVEWPARFQIWDERIVIDGAHNPSAAGALTQAWMGEFGSERATIILAVLRDKNSEAIIDALVPITSRFLLPQIRSERAESPTKLAALIKKRHLEYQTFASTSEAISAATKLPRRVLITGSLHFAGEAIATLRGDLDALEECAQ
ncbi:MAG: dihydrofolate synthase / folylpolyglutamate synthase [Verrucomicrobiota bacterium]